jgi:hypothetical protein
MSTEYPHIDTIYRRHMEGSDKGRLIVGDFTRPEFAYLAGNAWVGTEKVDGTNIRVMWGDSRLVSAALGQPAAPGRCEYGGKTDNAQLPTALLSRLREMFDPIDRSELETRLPKLGTAPITLYGEGYGAKIQKGGGNYKADGCDFVLFDVLVGTWWLQRDAIEEVADVLRLRVVPIVFEGRLFEACDLVRDGFKSEWGDFQAEGLVLKPAVELLARNGDRLITKIKTRDFR